MCDCDVVFFTEAWQCFEMPTGGRLFLSDDVSRQKVGIVISAGMWRQIDDASSHASSSRMEPGCCWTLTDVRVCVESVWRDQIGDFLQHFSIVCSMQTVLLP